LLQKRRTATRLTCGVFFSALFFIACTQPRTASAPTHDGLTIGVPEGSISSADQGVGQTAAGFSLEGLTQVSVDGRALPKLAEKLDWENDGLTLRLHLRPNVVFHDGTALTSTVVSEALRRAIAKPGNRALYPSLTDITAVRPVSELELGVDLMRASAFLPEDLELPLGVGPQNVGTGPFRLISRDKSQVVLEGFDRYYLGAPLIKRLVIRPFDALRTAWTSLLRGDLDMVTDVPQDAVEFIGNDAVQVIPFDRRYQFLVAFNSRKKPFSSPLVRRALNAAVDRNALITSVLRGHGTPATGPLWPKYWAYDSSMAAFNFDPALTASLLDGAGYPAGSIPGNSQGPPARLRFTCLLPANFNILERVALALQKQLYSAGVDMQFEVIPIDEYDTRIRDGQFEAVLVDLISGPTPGRTYIFWRSGKRFKGLNVFGYENEEAEKFYDILRTSTNDGAVRSATRGLQRVFLDDPPALFLAWNQHARAVRRNFEIPQEPGRDPIQTLWRWTPASSVQFASTQ
jgi:peptide/nickel transport system substrate-binding protein